MARLDYDRVAASYQQSRALPLEALEDWRAALGPYLPPADGAPVVDVGAGTGAFARAFAVWYGARVLGVEPSEGMRRQARVHGAHPRVTYLAGDAHALPLADRSAGAAWLSTVLHHLADLPACARELARILRPGAPVLVRSVFAGRLDGVTLFRWFPEARRVAATFPTVEATAAAFAGAGLAREHLAAVAQRSAPSLRAFLDRVRLRADTTLSAIDDEAYARGLAALERAAAAETTPSPVVDELDLLVFRVDRPAS